MLLVYFWGTDWWWRFAHWGTEHCWLGAVMTPLKALCPMERTKTCFSLALVIDKASLNAANLWWCSVDFNINFKTSQNCGQKTEPRGTTCSVVRKFCQLILQAFQNDTGIWKCSGQIWDCCPSSISQRPHKYKGSVLENRERGQARQRWPNHRSKLWRQKQKHRMPKHGTALIFMLLIAIIFSMNNLYMSLTNISFIPQPSYAHNNPFTLF